MCVATSGYRWRGETSFFFAHAYRVLFVHVSIVGWRISVELIQVYVYLVLSPRIGGEAAGGVSSGPFLACILGYPTCIPPVSSYQCQCAQCDD